MTIEIKYTEDVNSTWVYTKHHGLAELQLIENFYYRILSEVFLGKHVCLLTREPQTYSLAKGIGKQYETKSGRTRVLINEVINCDAALLNSISESEEFKRSLLFIIGCDNALSKDEINSVIEMIDTNYKEKSSICMAHCEHDGDSLHLYNTGLIIKDLRLLEDKHLRTSL